MDTKALKDIAQEFVDLLKTNAVEAGKNLADDLNAVRDYAATRMAHLSTIAAEPGFRQALIAERDNVALMAAGRAIDEGDAFDARLVGIVEGALAVGAKALATLAV